MRRGVAGLRERIRASLPAEKGQTREDFNLRERAANVGESASDLSRRLGMRVYPFGFVSVIPKYLLKPHNDQSSWYPLRIISCQAVSGEIPS